MQVAWYIGQILKQIQKYVSHLEVTLVNPINNLFFSELNVNRTLT